jgi:hypothetical protein
MLARRSLAPLWLTVGFAFGLIFGWAVFRETSLRVAAPLTAPKIASAEPDRTETLVNAGTLRAVEQTFARWGGYAVWENEATEIATWNARRKRHSDFYEVRRHDGKFYFRSLAALSRPIIDHGVSATMPIAFTEPQWMRDQFYRENPNYDPATAPRVELPPRPPERYPADMFPPLQRAPSGSTDSTTPKPLTPGAGG